MVVVVEVEVVVAVFLFLSPSEFSKFTTRNCIEFVSHQKMTTLGVKLPSGEAKQRSSSC
jgi:hypothetical protein